MEVVPLHRNPTLLAECCAILNDEWPRSETARLFSLQKSCDKLPCSLVFIEKKSEATHVIGHSRLSHVLGQKEACMVESVVILKECRGKGLGKLLMQLTEDFARRMNFTIMYLSTHDKQEFYKKIGYSFCDPLQLFGSPAHTFNKAKCKLPNTSSTQKQTGPTQTSKTEQLVSNDGAKESSHLISKKCTPPAPPIPIKKPNSDTNGIIKKQWMKKTIQPDIGLASTPSPSNINCKLKKLFIK